MIIHIAMRILGTGKYLQYQWSQKWGSQDPLVRTEEQLLNSKEPSFARYCIIASDLCFTET